MRTLNELQLEMRAGFLDGAPGMLVSASVWLAAGITVTRWGMDAAVWTLLVGGALIHPVTIVTLKALGRSARVSKGSPLAQLAMATTIWLIVGCVLSYGLHTANPTWFFPAMLLVIGSRYLAFQTLFGHRTYWLCGMLLIAAGYFCGSSGLSPATAAFVGSGIEAAFAAFLLAQNARARA
ncbi:MAG: hypothetical protein NDI84_19105 [Steroidobacteraceae bacterium]|nr:hypothetical protein [Steroidobacteraceae bacterium]